MMWYWGSGTPWWGWLFGCIAMVVFWGAVVWGVWYVVTHAVPRTELGPRNDPAERVLDERLARGEIDTVEYARLRDVIRSEGRPDSSGRTTASTGGPR